MLHLGTDEGEWSASCHNRLTQRKQLLVPTEQKARWVRKLFLTLWMREKSVAAAECQTTDSLSTNHTD